MSVETSTPPQAANLASIFQKAYARAVALQRMDEQIAAMLEQRQKLETEFRDAQAEVNAECERMLNSASIAPAKMLAQMSHGTSVGAAMVDPLTDGNGARLGLAAAMGAAAAGKAALR
jgi:hypothetical protein